MRIGRTDRTTLIAIVLIILPALLGLTYVALFGVNVPFYDQFDFLPMIDKLYNGTITGSDLFSQHNEHRLVFPRLAMLGLAALTGYNTVAEMYFSWALTLGIMALIYLLFKDTVGKSQLILLEFIPVAWLAFSFRQFENILWGWQIQIYMCVLAFVAAVYFLNRAKQAQELNFLIAIGCAVVSMFSFFNGLIVWPAGLLFILMSDMKDKLLAAAAWTVTGIMFCLIYFIGWHSPENHPSLLFGLQNPLTFLQYLLINIGSSFGFEKNLALVAGLVLLAFGITLTYLLFKDKQLTKNKVWVTFMFFSLAVSLSCAVGRSGFGIDQALTSRYTTFTGIGIIGIYAIATRLFNERKSENDRLYKAIYGLILLLLAAGLIIGYGSGFISGGKWSAHAESTIPLIQGYKTLGDDELKAVHPDVYVVRRGAGILEKYHLNVFSG